MFDLLLQVRRLMQGFEPDWFVAGGWALDLFLGAETRPHDDIEIAVFRRDQLALQKHFAGWRLQKAVSGALQDWSENEFLQLPIHEIHCFNDRGEPPRLEVLLNETDGADWIFRRDQRIVKSRAETFSTTDANIKFLRPEIVLLYKSKNPRAKDERDFQAAIKHLDPASKTWLKRSLAVCSPEHVWLESL